MKGREREESKAQVLGWRPSALGAGFVRVGCNLMSVGAASTIRLHGERYGVEYAGATGRKWRLGAGGRDLQDRTENSKTARFGKKEACSAGQREEKKGIECTGS